MGNTVHLHNYTVMKPPTSNLLIVVPTAACIQYNEIKCAAVTAQPTWPNTVHWIYIVCTSVTSDSLYFP